MKNQILSLAWSIAEALRGYIVVADVLDRVADLVDPDTGDLMTAEIAIGMLDGVDAITVLPGPRGAGARFAASSRVQRAEELRARAAALIYTAQWPRGADRVEA
jgi:hypothetical protein